MVVAEQREYVEVPASLRIAENNGIIADLPSDRWPLQAKPSPQGRNTQGRKRYRMIRQYNLSEWKVHELANCRKGIWRAALTVTPMN